VAGSPPIVDTILAKIAACDVFVPDVTFMPASGERRTPNPNVMIEYGYALKTPGPERIVAVTRWKWSSCVLDYLRLPPNAPEYVIGGKGLPLPESCLV